MGKASKADKDTIYTSCVLGGSDSSQISKKRIENTSAFGMDWDPIAQTTKY